MTHRYIRQRDRRIKIAVGLVLVLTVCVSAILSWLNKSNLNALQNTVLVQARTDSAQGLSTGMVVNLVGIPIGHLEHIELKEDNKIWLSLAIFEPYHDKIKKDSKLHINSPVFGSLRLDLDLGSQQSAVIGAGDIIATVKPLSIDDIIDEVPAMQLQISQLLAGSNELIQQLSSKQGPLSQSLEKLDNSLELIQQLTVDLHRSLAGVPGILNNIESSTKELRRLGASLNDSRTGVPKMLSSSQRIAATLEGSINQKNEEVSQLLHSIAETVKSADLLLKTLQEISDQLKQAAPQTPLLMERAKEVMDQSNTMIQAIKNSALLGSVFAQDTGQKDLLIESPRDEVTQ